VFEFGFGFGIGIGTLICMVRFQSKSPPQFPGVFCFFSMKAKWTTTSAVLLPIALTQIASLEGSWPQTYEVDEKAGRNSILGFRAHQRRVYAA
jgi:hypothetical protein